MFKKKGQKEIERKVRIRQSKNVIQNYILKLDRLQKKVFIQGKEYAKLGDKHMVKNQASKYLALESRMVFHLASFLFNVPHHDFCFLYDLAC